ncbi:MAG TPA: SRPBCC domain-containing protein [Ktedonosporobacter sp.]|nr:SRPBCC domain-containing protein [Ktedonosporobacter sp.]
MQNTLIAKAQITISAPIASVWDALVNPAMIKQYLFGTNTVSDWQEGSPILWQGIWEGKPYEDKGVILQLKPEHILQYSHFSPLTGQPDVPENYHTVTIELSPSEEGTLLILSQDNNSTEEDREHSEKTWEMMLTGLKKLLEP